jgi:hypothetical protein
MQHGLAGRLAGLAFVLVGAVALAPAAQARQSDAQVRQSIIRQSIAGYSGNCPCPHSTMSYGRSCGGRSAYSRPGGGSPICYASDISKAQVDAYRRR